VLRKAGSLSKQLGAALDAALGPGWENRERRHREEAERLRRIVDSVRSKTALDVVAEKLAAQDAQIRAERERDEVREEVKRLREFLLKGSA
jgi:aspartate aminotransferase-like enzyme